ncbi:MAG: LytTR family DNA-binding domain-containing protein [Bacteroidales bacterium]|jgi:DNA-binding LytR/AlgR family response regulator|nr:LytTR family DNA-binding domain-containing protein [Bacteroidales bacterium]
MEKYKYIIVDDGFVAHLVLTHYFNNYPDYECVGKFISPVVALAFIQEQKVDLILLDIEMPEITGFQLLEALEKNIFVALLTAFSEKYAEESHKYYFDKDLVMFCNKAQLNYFFPKIIARFEKMIQEKEVLERINRLCNSKVHIFPKTINGEAISLSDILLIEIIGHYSVLKMKNRKEYITRMSMSELTERLPKQIFLQISRSKIINIIHSTDFTETTVCIDGYFVNISRNHRKKVIQRLREFREEFKELKEFKELIELMG